MIRKLDHLTKPAIIRKECRDKTRRRGKGSQKSGVPDRAIEVGVKLNFWQLPAQLFHLHLSLSFFSLVWAIKQAPLPHWRRETDKYPTMKNKEGRGQEAERPLHIGLFLPYGNVHNTPMVLSIYNAVRKPKIWNLNGGKSVLFIHCFSLMNYEIIYKKLAFFLLIRNS